MKSFVDQISELVILATRDIDFVENLFHDIKRFIISQSLIKNKIWIELVDRVLRLEEILSSDYQLIFNRFIPISSTSHHDSSQFTRFDRFGNSDRSSNSDRFDNWR